jgi:ATP phosphoribosyltransferase regulatory subunit
MRKWILPEHIEDVLPAEAERVEALRRVLLDHFRSAGYRLVQPPLVEHLESLLTGTGRDLDLQTFKVVDPLSGRLLGVRADITPQVARIDAHLLNEPGVTRLCYAGSVLRTVPAGLAATREVLQIGAELYGEPGIAGDREVLSLALSALAAAGLAGLHLDLGHVGVYRALAAGSGVGANGEDAELFAAVSTKDLPAVAQLTARLAPAWRDALCALPTLYGPADEVLARARDRLPDTPPIRNALAALAAVAQAAGPQVAALHIDLADLTGYHYQNGVIFSVFTAGESTAIGNGGRYDGIGKSFGRARPATGFTLDLRQLAGVLARSQPSPQST